MSLNFVESDIMVIFAASSIILLPCDFFKDIDSRFLQACLRGNQIIFSGESSETYR